MDITLWDDASRNFEEEQAVRRLHSAKARIAGTWSFLANAQTFSEFEQRKELAVEALADAVWAVTSDDHEVEDTWKRLHASLDEDFAIVVEARKLVHKTALNEEPDSNYVHYNEYGGVHDSVPGHVAEQHARETSESGQTSNGWKVELDHDGAHVYEPSGGYRWYKKVTKEAPPAKQNDVPDADGDYDGDALPFEASLNVLAVVRVLAGEDAGKFIIVDENSGYKVGGPFASKPEAEEAIASGKFRGKNVKIERSGEGDADKDDAHKGGRGAHDNAGGTKPFDDKGHHRKKESSGGRHPFA